MRTDQVRTALMFALVLASAWARAQGSPYVLSLAESVSQDSNIYRVPDGVAPGAGASRSDTAWITTLGAGLDQVISRQRLRADLSLRDIRFSRNKSLNNSGGGLRLGWDWSTVDQWSGAFSTSVDRSLVRFDNTATDVDRDRNIGTTRLLEATLRRGIVTRWTAEAGFSHQQIDYSAATFANRDFRQDSYSLGVRYAPGSALSANAGVRALEGRFPRFATLLDGSTVADRFHGRYLDLGARYAASAASEFEAQWSLGRTRYDRASATDFSGLTGSLLWTWRPAGEHGRTRLDSRLSRDRGLDSSLLGFYLNLDTGTLASGRFADFSRTSTTASVTVQHELTGKLSLSLRAAATERDLRSTSQDIFGHISAVSGTDRGRQFGVGARWQAMRSVVVGCDAGREWRRASNALSSNLSSQTSSCFAQLSLS